MDHLPAELTQFTGGGKNISSMRSAHDQLDAQAIRAALDRRHGNHSAAARDLGIHKTTLFRRIKKLGLSPHSAKN